MNLKFTSVSSKQIEKLPKEIVKKLYKQACYLLDNPKHPSLRSKKMSGEDRFEARLDRQYRFTYHLTGEDVVILTVGSHDTGLGKK